MRVELPSEGTILIKKQFVFFKTLPLMGKSELGVFYATKRFERRILEFAHIYCMRKNHRWIPLGFVEDGDI